MENKIINYINQTPENTNPSVLATLLGELKVPKPLTYDYMPEGYPKKSVQTTMLMEEQQVAFASEGNTGQYTAYLTELLEIAEGQVCTVKWDGTEYECVCSVFNSSLILGNLSISGLGDDTGEPFLYISAGRALFATFDTSASHIISVKKTEEVVTPMAKEFLPATAATQGQLIVVVYNVNSSGTIFRADKTYSEIRAAVESGMSVVIHYKVHLSAADYDVYYHTLAEDGYYQFFSFEEVSGDISFKSIDISEENGEMAIKKKNLKLQIVTA